MRSGSEILVSNPALIAGLEIAVFDPQLYPHLRIKICITPPCEPNQRCGSKKAFASQDLRIREPILRSGSETLSWGLKTDPQVKIKDCITAIILYHSV